MYSLLALQAKWKCVHLESLKRQEAVALRLHDGVNGCFQLTKANVFCFFGGIQLVTPFLAFVVGRHCC